MNRYWMIQFLPADIDVLNIIKTLYINCRLINVKKFKMNHYLIINNHHWIIKYCKITNITVSKTRKNGISKYHFTGIDIFTGFKYEILESSNNSLYSFF